MRINRFLTTLLMAGILWMPAAKETWYLDPGSGSFILQMLIAGAAGAIYVFRGYFHRLFTFFKRSDKSEDDED